MPYTAGSSVSAGSSLKMTPPFNQYQPTAQNTVAATTTVVSGSIGGTKTGFTERSIKLSPTSSNYVSSLDNTNNN
jgi:hypothetical protein